MRYSLSGEPSKAQPGAFKRMQIRLKIEAPDVGKEYLLTLEAVPSRAEEAASRTRSTGKRKRPLRPKEAPK